MKKKILEMIFLSILLLVMGLSYLCISEAHAQDVHLGIGDVWPEDPIGVKSDPRPPRVCEMNALRLSVKNMGSDDAIGVTVRFWVTHMGLLSPFGPGWVEYVGESAPFTVPGGATVWSPWVDWHPSAPDHQCIRAIVMYAGRRDGMWCRNIMDIRECSPGACGPGDTKKVDFRIWSPENGTAGTNLGLNVTHGLPPSITMYIVPPPPYNTPIDGYVDAELTIKIQENASYSTYHILVEGTWENGTVYSSFEVRLHVEPPVGGIWIPVDKLGLLAPYIGLASMLIATVATAVYVKRVKHREEKQ